jgi:sulfide dehydrogenase cytochrome subunit
VGGSCALPATVVAACLFALVAAAAAPPAVPPSGAASCTGCHAADPKIETRVPRISGRPPAEIVAAMEAFRSGQKPATVMDRIAKGFTDAEIRAIADWVSAQK